MKIKLTTTHIILLSFLAAILVGAFILTLPISSASGKSTGFINALFTATTSVCVTGLVTVPTFSHWSVFGKVIILILIQMGGLGIITVTTGIFLSLKRKLKLKDSILIQDAFNLNSLSDIGSFVKRVLIGTAIAELLGALLYMTAFVPEFGVKGIWYSLFNSVSAFCNAGIDIIKPNSLMDYALDPIVNITTMLLVVFGGLGFIVWFDVIDIIKRKKSFKHLSLHSKIALSSTLILIVIPAALYFIFEYSNTMEGFTTLQRIQASLFQSVTTRTAGFAALDQGRLTNPSALLTLLLMFIGGSPVSTAGGIKTVTLTVIVAASISAIRNKNETTLFSRAIPLEILKKSIAVLFMAFTTVFVSSVMLSLVTDASIIDILFESVSATATVGLSRNLTDTLNEWGKMIIICTMYLGRVGPISLAFLFRTKNTNLSNIKNPTEKISVG